MSIQEIKDEIQEKKTELNKLEKNLIKAKLTDSYSIVGKCFVDKRENPENGSTFIKIIDFDYIHSTDLTSYYTYIVVHVHDLFPHIIIYHRKKEDIFNVHTDYCEISENKFNEVYNDISMTLKKIISNCDRYIYRHLKD